MARNDEEKIRALEAEAVPLGYSVAERSFLIGELVLANQFRWIAAHIMNIRSATERKRVRQEITERTKELGDVVREKHIQHHLPFSCIDEYDECVRKRKRQKKSTYLCDLALFICLAKSMPTLLAAIAAAADPG